MPKPPKTPPHSDIDGVNRDARTGQAPSEAYPDPGGALRRAREEGTARPAQTPPLR